MSGHRADSTYSSWKCEITEIIEKTIQVDNIIIEEKMAKMSGTHDDLLDSEKIASWNIRKCSITFVTTNQSENFKQNVERTQPMERSDHRQHDLEPLPFVRGLLPRLSVGPLQPWIVFF
jgi:hypothetical protein